MAGDYKIIAILFAVLTGFFSFRCEDVFASCSDLTIKVNNALSVRRGIKPSIHQPSEVLKHRVYRFILDAFPNSSEKQNAAFAAELTDVLDQARAEDMIDSVTSWLDEKDFSSALKAQIWRFALTEIQERANDANYIFLEQKRIAGDPLVFKSQACTVRINSDGHVTTEKTKAPQSKKSLVAQAKKVISDLKPGVEVATNVEELKILLSDLLSEDGVYDFVIDSQMNFGISPQRRIEVDELLLGNAENILSKMPVPAKPRKHTISFHGQIKILNGQVSQITNGFPQSGPQYSKINLNTAANLLKKWGLPFENPAVIKFLDRPEAQRLAGGGYTGDDEEALNLYNIHSDPKLWEEYQKLKTFLVKVERAFPDKKFPGQADFLTLQDYFFDNLTSSDPAKAKEAREGISKMHIVQALQEIGPINYLWNKRSNLQELDANMKWVEERLDDILKDIQEKSKASEKP